MFIPRSIRVRRFARQFSQLFLRYFTFTGGFFEAAQE
jgi:hypothetical protein